MIPVGTTFLRGGCSRGNKTPSKRVKPSSKSPQHIQDSNHSLKLIQLKSISLSLKLALFNLQKVVENLRLLLFVFFETKRNPSWSIFSFCSVYSTDSLWIYLKYECTHSLWANSNEKCIWTRSRIEIKTARIQNFSYISNLYESFNIQYELKGDFMISLSGR